MKLPRPDDFRRYKLTDGSIIYPSGGDYTHDGVQNGEEPAPSGVTVAFGHFIMTNDSIKYYSTAQLALQELEFIRNVV